MKKLFYPFLMLILIFILFSRGCKDNPVTPTPPSSPSNLTAFAVSSTQINLSWKDNSNDEDGFKIECVIGNTSNFVEIASLPKNTTSYQDTGLSASTSYSYRIRAYNSAGNSGYTDTTTMTTKADIPIKPSNLTATVISETQINLTWKDNSNNEDGFKIERAPGGTSNFSHIASLAANTTSYQNSGLSSATSYSYRILAYNSAGNSGYSNPASATTQSAVIIPAAPSNLVATAVSSSQINLSWNDNSNNEGGFKLERAPGGTSNFTQIASLAANTTSYQNSGLSSATSYSYRIRAYNGAGNSGYSNPASATTQSVQLHAPDISAPSTSTGTFTVSVTYNYWPTLASNLDDYELEESTTSASSGFTKIQSSPGGTHTSPYNFNLTRSAGTYYYRARVYVGMYSLHYSPYSSVVTVTVTQAKANLHIVNNTHYAMIDIQLNGVQKVGQGMGLDVNKSIDFEYNNSGNVSYKLGIGFWDNNFRNDWFIQTGTIQVITGSIKTITFNNPSIAQLLSNFSSSCNWNGYYYDSNLGYHTTSFTFYNNGSWKFYNDGVLQSTGTVTLVSWADYAVIVTFKVCGSCTNIQLPYPFGQFYYKNGPSNWPTIEYTKQ